MSVPCAHSKTFRGKDIPRRYGSNRSEVCSDCGCYRALDHFDHVLGDWRPASEYESDTAEDVLE